MKSHTKKTVLLVSGLSVFRSNSFSRQLGLLGKGLRERGWRVLLAGRNGGADDLPSNPIAGTGRLGFAELSSGMMEDMANRYQPAAAILLGYPDQFPFLERQWPFPVFLWAQFSSPPEHPYLAGVVGVPLTEMTRIFLFSAGLSRISRVIPHAVDTDVYRTSTSRNHRPPERRFVVGSVGANSLRKRFDLLFRGFGLFSSRHPESTLLVKTNRTAKPGGYDLHRLAEAEGITSKLRIVDHELSDAEMAALYRSMDVYVHAAEWEGFGIPVLEAMSCGIPVVTPPIQGPGEVVPYTDWIVWDSRVVRDGKTVLRWANPGAVAAALEHAWKHPGGRSASGRLGRSTAVAGYDYRIVTSLWERVLI